MGRRGKKTRFSIILALIVTTPVIFAFYRYYSLSIADFFYVRLKFEAPDQVNLSAVCKDKFFS